MTEGIKSEKMLGKFTEVTPGRPTIKEHRHPFDDVRKHVDRKKADPLTNLFILTLLAGEQQTMNFYMNLGNTFKEQLGRGLYQEIAMIEEQHVTQYESLLDPTTSWIENALLHEYNECWLYWSFMEQEKDAKIKPIWELHLNMELTHLQTVAEIARKMGVEPEQLVPASLPKPLEFKSQIDYVRGILAEQVTWNACETQIGPPEKLPENSRYKATQDLLNAKGAPSEEVINMNRSKSGKEYRCELKGEHPVRELRSK